MKRFLSLCLILMMCIGMSARTFVLIVGVSNYGNEEINLNQTTKDAKAFKKIMEVQTKDIILLTSRYANRANVMEKMSAICNRAQQNDRIIFFFSGHGMPGGICAYDGTISYADLINQLDKSEAKEKICYIDACHAGTLADNKLSKEKNSLSAAMKGKNDQVFLVGCRADEYSFEHPWVGAGFFTQALIKGIRGKADFNGNRQVTVIELFKYIYKDVVRRSDGKQHPQLIAPKTMQDVVVMAWN